MKMIITMLLATLVLAGCDPAESQPADTGAGKSGPAAADNTALRRQLLDLGGVPRYLLFLSISQPKSRRVDSTVPRGSRKHQHARSKQNKAKEAFGEGHCDTGLSGASPSSPFSSFSLSRLPLFRFLCAKLFPIKLVRYREKSGAQSLHFLSSNHRIHNHIIKAEKCRRFRRLFLAFVASTTVTTVTRCSTTTAWEQKRRK